MQPDFDLAGGGKADRSPLTGPIHDDLNKYKI